MNNSCLIVIFYILLNLFYINARNYIPTHLFVEVFEPKGLRISMRDVKNSSDFEIYGYINKKVTDDLEADFNKLAEKPCNGRWSLYFPNVVVQAKDKIYVRYYLKIGNTVHTNGYVTQIKPNYITAARDTQPNDLQQCCQDDDETKSDLGILTMKYEHLYKEVQTLKELLYQVTNNSTKNNKLMLVGKKPPGVSAIKDIRQFIIDKLKLYDFEYNIVQADYTECGISFEMETSVQKKIILSRAFELLETSRFKIKEISECQPENYYQIPLGARNS